MNMIFFLSLLVVATMADNWAPEYQTEECLSSSQDSVGCASSTLWPSWGTLRSRNKKYEAVMQNDGNFVVYKKYNPKDYSNPLWSTRSHKNPGKRPFYLAMQRDGNLVIYTSDKKKNAVWSSGTAGKGQGSFRVVMQNDGNLVLYDKNKKATWSSGTRQ